MTIKWIGSPNFDNNRKPITHIVLHWIVGKLEAADAVFQDDLRDTSAHYGIGQSEIHQYVEEKNVAYHAGNYEMNQKSIGIEHEGGPDLPITDVVYNQSIELIADICKRYNIPVDDYHIIPHRQVKATQCPGTLDIQRIINGVNSVIIAQPIAKFTDQTKIPANLLNWPEDLEIQQIRGLLGDLTITQNQLKDCAVELSKYNSSPHKPLIPSVYTWSGLLDYFLKLLPTNK